MQIQSVLGVLVIALLAGVNSEDENWSVEEENCVDELKLDKSKIQALNNKGITQQSDSDFNNFLACYWKKKGALEENGEINWEKVDQLLEEEFKKATADWPALKTIALSVVADYAIKECKTEHEQGETDGQTVSKFLNCVTKKIRSFLRKNGEVED